MTSNLGHRIVHLLQAYWPVFVVVLIAMSAIVFGPTIYANLSTRSLRYDMQVTPAAKIPTKDVALVFGAGLYGTSRPTPYLQWRVEAAVQLYKAHRVKKLLMTGDNSRQNHDEPTVMKKVAMSLGVPAKDIVLDYAGFNTYDSCYRAGAIFGVKHAIAVTQGYHLPRAVMACNALGIDTIGVSAVHNKGRSWKLQYIVREWISTDKIVIQQILKPKPTLLGKREPIKL